MSDATRNKRRARLRGRAIDVSRIVGCDQSTVARWKSQPDFPPVAADGTFELFAVLNWHIRKQVAAERETELMPELSGPVDSEALERYRAARAGLAEIELAQRRGEVILLNDFEAVMPSLFGPWRTFSEHLKRLENPELLERLEQANERVLAGLEKLYQVTSDIDSAT
jgi:hypothetical protein